MTDVPVQGEPRGPAEWADLVSDGTLTPVARLNVTTADADGVTTQTAAVLLLSLPALVASDHQSLLRLSEWLAENAANAREMYDDAREATT